MIFPVRFIVCTKAAFGAVALGLLVASAGCKKQAEPGAATFPELTNQLGSNVSRGAPVPQTQAQPQALAVSADASTKATLDQLTKEVRRWIVRSQRPPASFEEFVSSARVQVPPAPAGKKYELTKQMRVILVDR